MSQIQGLGRSFLTSCRDPIANLSMEDCQNGLEFRLPYVVHLQVLGGVAAQPNIPLRWMENVDWRGVGLFTNRNHRISRKHKTPQKGVTDNKECGGLAEWDPHCESWLAAHIREALACVGADICHIREGDSGHKTVVATSTARTAASRSVARWLIETILKLASPMGPMRLMPVSSLVTMLKRANCL